MFRNNEFVCVVHLAHDADGSGASKQDAKPMVSGELFQVPEGVVITAMDFHVDVAVAGSTAVDIGDGDDADGYVAASDVTLATPGVYNGSGVLLGAKKYAAGDSIDLVVTGASSAGEAVVVARGYRV